MESAPTEDGDVPLKPSRTAKGVRFFGTSMAPSPTGGSGNAVRGVAVSYGERHTFSGDHTTCGVSRFAPTGLEMWCNIKYADATALEPWI